MARKNLKPKQEEAAIDMTPMLDVVFIMLIFFIVTGTFVKESGIQVRKPEAITAEKKPKANIFIGISEKGEIFMQKAKLDVKEVRATVEDLLLETPESSVVIQSDMQANSGILIDVLDAVKKAGVQNISVAAEK